MSPIAVRMMTGRSRVALRLAQLAAAPRSRPCAASSGPAAPGRAAAPAISASASSPSVGHRRPGSPDASQRSRSRLRVCSSSSTTRIDARSLRPAARLSLPTLPCARLSKRVNSERKTRSTLPIGPLRCLATISSHRDGRAGAARPPPPSSPSPSSSRWMNITTSASCSMAPDSRRSESIGLPPLRSSTLRLSWLSAMIGHLQLLGQLLEARG